MNRDLRGNRDILLSRLLFYSCCAGTASNPFNANEFCSEKLCSNKRLNRAMNHLDGIFFIIIIIIPLQNHKTYCCFLRKKSSNIQ